MMIKLHEDKTVLVHEGENVKKRLAEIILEGLVKKGYPVNGK